MTELYVEIDFREVALGSQKEILKECVASDHVAEYDVVEDDDEADKSGLETGDIIINDAVCIERKAPGDFVQSMTGGHLEDQLDTMYDQYDHVFVLVSGTMDDLYSTRSRVHANAIRAFVASMSVRWQTPPIFCGSEEELAKTAIDLGRKVLEPLKRRPGQPDITVDNDLGPIGQAAMLADDIGPKTAERIQESGKFATVRDLCDAEIDELTDIEGIGPKTASKLKMKLT